MLSSLMERYERLYRDMYKDADPRAHLYPLMNSWLPTFLTCVAYVVFVKLGQKWMRNREPYNIRTVMIAYNATMVIFSIYLVYEMFACIYLNNMKLGCVAVDYSMDPVAVRLFRVGWLFYITKFIEMADTYFFILRKKFNLITFLHVFHHASMPASVWFGIKFSAGGSGVYYTLVNTIIHVFMYTYYGIAAAGPQFERYLWWKQYMTVGQMIQFIFLMLHYGPLLFMDCSYPRVFNAAIFIYAVIFFVLFSNYFIQAYLKPRRRRDIKATKDQSEKMANGFTKVEDKPYTNGTAAIANGVHHRKKETQ